MSDDQQLFELLMEEVTRLVGRAESVHTPHWDFGTGVPLYRSETHTIEAIGKNPGINMTRLAERMGVTKGAISQMLARLARKKLVLKRSIPGSAKEVTAELTDLGRIAFENHERLHHLILAALRDYYGPALTGKLEQMRDLVADLSKILTIQGERLKSG